MAPPRRQEPSVEQADQDDQVVTDTVNTLTEAVDPTPPPSTPGEITIRGETGERVSIPHLPSAEAVVTYESEHSRENSRDNSRNATPLEPSPRLNRRTARKRTGQVSGVTQPRVSNTTSRSSEPTPSTSTGRTSRPPEPTPSTSTGRTSRQTSKSKKHPSSRTEYEVRAIVGHRKPQPNREFRLKWSDRSCTWEKESANLRGCYDIIKAYCSHTGIPDTSIVPFPGGFAGLGPLVEANCVTLEETVRKSIQFGDPEGLQPQAFVSFEHKDAIYIRQIGRHFFTIMYIHAKKLALVTDGANCFEDDILAQQLIQDDFSGIKILPVEFVGQSYANWCATSAAAAAIEFQRCYKIKQIPTQVKPPHSKIARISAILHKAPEPKVTEHKPIAMQTKGETCPKCNKHFPNAKNRRCLTLHKCAN